jgi:hypothetical protein
VGRTSWRFLLILSVCGALALQLAALPAPAAGTTVFADTFSGSHLDTSKWQVVKHGCDSTQNVTVGNGRLHLRDGRVGTSPYCGSKVMARHLFQPPIDISARIRFDLPAGAHQGMPLFGTRCGWPCGGEIDSVEEISQLQYSDNDSIWTSCATDPTCGGPKHPQRCGAANHYPAGESLSHTWHVYGITWLPGSITWRFDGKAVFTMTMSQLEAMGCTTPFNDTDNPFRLFLNNSTGGPWAGPPSGPGYPDFMQVDWIRVTAA